MYQQTSVGGWGTMFTGVFDYKDRDEGDDSCRSNWIMIITMRWPAVMRGNSSRNKTEIFRTLLKCLFPIKGEACLYSRNESQTWGVKNGSVYLRSEAQWCLEFSGSWQWSSNCPKPILIWFGICVLEIIFLFPNQTGIGLKNPKHFLGVTFPNQTGFGLEKDTEWNVAELNPQVHIASGNVCISQTLMSPFWA